MPAALLEMRGIAKRFPGVQALADVDFTVRAGEVHALMGENGAGKSTLIKVLTGVHARDTGTCRLAGAHIAPRAPIEAEELGISTVYQEVNLIPRMSVAENIVLGRQPRRRGLFFDRRAIRDRAAHALARLGVRVDDLGAEVGSLSVAVQQMVAIARALDVDARLLVLDEPTSSLDEREVAELFDALCHLRDEGLGIVFITHFLEQVYQIADRITVLRNGELVGEYETATLPRLELIGKMLGRPVEEVATTRPVGQAASAEGEGVALRARNLTRHGAVGPIDLEVRRGEVLGLAGLLGSGRTETARLLFGIDRPDRGEIEVAGSAVTLRSPRDAIARGLAFSSEDRKTEGLLPALSVRENIVLALQARRGAFRPLARMEADRLAAHYIDTLDIRTPDADAPVGTLSGGNQQKVLLARWLAVQPTLLLLDEPTRGIDVGAKAEIEELVANLAGEGMAILFISSELEEVARAAGRVVVLRDRHQVGELAGQDVDEQRIMAVIAEGT